LTRRLLAWSRLSRLFLVLSVILGVLRALLLIAQAWLLARVVAGAFMDGLDLEQLRTPLILLMVVTVGRAGVAWATEVVGDLCSCRVKSTMRTALLERLVLLGREGHPVRSSGDATTLAVRGIDALDGYFGRYLPQTVLAVVVPLSVVAAVAWQDWLSAVIIVVTLPLIPVFMALIGWATRTHNERQVATLQRLSGHFLDVVEGLTTLKVFRRSKAQVEVIGEVTDNYRHRLMKTLRITFLSSLVLELLASVSVAIIAVAIGLRLLDGRIHLQAALFVLVLAPEAYAPLRQLGAEYHASAEGVAAAEQVFDVLSEPLPPRGVRTDVPDPATHAIAVNSLRFSYPGRDVPALDGVNLVVEPGEFLAVTGPSGCGKSTLLSVLLSLVHPDSGEVRIGDAALAELDPDCWRSHVAWVPQRPHLFATTLGDNIRLGRPDADDSEVALAVERAGLADLVSRLPEGLATVLGEGGWGLSGGERQRVGLARAFLRDAPLLLLDEPTASLDGDTESAVMEAVARLAVGRTVVMVAHRPALVAMADREVRLDLTAIPAQAGL
jgi:thiol reductant ABC exporter CydD subunit